MDTKQRLPWATLICSLIALAAFVSPALSEWLVYQVDQVSSGQLWRLLTCHLTHFGGEHLFWDLAVFIVLGCCCERQSLGRWLTVIGAAGILIPATLWATQPQLSTYRGLSGLDTALFATLATSWIVQHNRAGEYLHARLGGLLLLGLLGKTVFEVATGQCLFVDIQRAAFTPVPTAHLIGAVVGMCIGAMPRPTTPAVFCTSDLAQAGFRNRANHPIR